MVRGFRAAVAEVDDDRGTARQTLMRAGKAFMDAAGGASGALVGGWLAATGQALPVGNDLAIDAEAFGAALQAGLDTVSRLGQAQAGDKTMVDTLEPFVRTYRQHAIAGASTSDAWQTALTDAEAGMRSTTQMVSRKGRASRLGERSRGHQDAGATSIYYVLRSFGEALSATPGLPPTPTKGES